jgi:hypothetical protein
MCNSLRDNSILSLHMKDCGPLSTSMCLVDIASVASMWGKSYTNMGFFFSPALLDYITN